ncbi:hypothetical protein INT47_003894 [Mucor saturninus]|uniref:chitin synthase n=1 Tax=Mucor saturninus TaxID=64648 RepID=A0A8H7V365_9FUNG|nr:hypothetical protein INT47_003894 [Mucor saturninus]
MSNKQQEAIVDLSTISDLDEKRITDILNSRFSNYNIYTHIGPCHLIAINPFKQLAQNDTQTSEDYVASYKEISPESPIKLNPHVFELTNRAFFHMRRTGNDQAVFLNGESGSGKSEVRNLVIEHLVALSSSKKRSKVQAQIIHGQKVLSAFGSAKTAYNNLSASRFGLYTEIQFNERGRMLGAKNLHYFLEKSRLTASKSTEGNFNIFYWLLAGTSPDEKQVLQLKDDPVSYTYLSRYGRPILGADKDEFDQLKGVMRLAGFKRDHLSRIIQLLAAILHLGNISFDNIAGVGTGEGVTIKNVEALNMVADLLGVEVRELESVLTFKTTKIGKDVTTLILDAEQATSQRDELAQTLYSLLFSWLVERINGKTCVDQFNSFIGILDFPGTQTSGFGSVGFDQFCIDYANERVYNFLSTRMFKTGNDELLADLIDVPEVPYNDTSACVELFERHSRGICAVFNKMSEKTTSGKRVFSDSNAVEAILKYNAESPALAVKTSNTGIRQFAVNHFAGEVTYDTTGFITKNNNQLLVDFISLFRGGPDMPASWNSFTLELFSDENLAIDSHPLGGMADLVEAQQSAKPTRMPSMRQSKRNSAAVEKKERDETTGVNTVLSQIQHALDDLINSFSEATVWSVFCVRPNATESSTQFDKQVVQSQIKAFDLKNLATRMKQFYLISCTHEDFLSKYAIKFSNMGLDHSGTQQEQCESVKEMHQWLDADMVVGTSKVFLSHASWHMLEEHLKSLEKQDIKSNSVKNAAAAESILDAEDGMNIQTRGMDQHNDGGRMSYLSELNPPKQMFMGNATDSYYEGSQYGDSKYTGSQYGDTRTEGTYTPPVLSPPEDDINATEEQPSSMTPGRKRWLVFVWAITFWVPSYFLMKCGRMKRKDVRLAWREKVALCFIITFMCAFVIGFLVFFGDIICPKQNVYSLNELQIGDGKSEGFVSIRGEVFDLGAFAYHHYPGVVSSSAVLMYKGQDATNMFPIQPSDLCEGVSPYVSLDYTQNLTDVNAQYHDFRYASGDYRPNWYFDQMTMLRKSYKKGNMGIESKALKDQAQGSYTLNGSKMNRIWAVIDDHVYDLTTYTLGGRYLSIPEGGSAPTEAVDVNFLNPYVVELFQKNSGGDISEAFHALQLTDAEKNRELACIRNLYYAGLVDNRNSVKCQFSTYFLLAVTICLCLVIFAKFCAALRFGTNRMPEESDKFVICQVTCYTEDEESLRKTIDSLGTLHYDDKRKLILVICDGMIIGSGNDRPTPRIVLDIFGVDPSVDPEPVSFISVGEGMKQHNRAKIYSGLYVVNGHVVPYLVVAKVGAPNERQKPGNRGKRDSQLVLMQFLNRLQYDAPMNPMQLEMYHQMKNIIGISPEMYDYVLMVDADTEVMREGLTHLVASMAHDAKIIGLCGETTIANEKDSWVTMIQVYEYFISHHMIKSFESLFSTVSCLPGCFTMYRVRTVDGQRPLFVANEIIADYTINVVDTLHKKNLLYLGEDRYLTTLLLKHFPNFKTKFNPDAQCKTNAPDTWDVLISQRRRWINSTVHNLSELIFLPKLCGFCCFSMRFVIMLDLFSTMVQPALLAYLGYLIYALTQAKDQIPYITIITLCCTYGLQILIFIINKRWEYIAWFFISILALPIFSFWIPVYSYWHFDDFSWGNTRVVVGEKGKKMAVADEGEFDPKTIPLISWSQYERMLSSESYSDGMSQRSGMTSSPMPGMSPGPGGMPAYSVSGGQSVYGGYGGGGNPYSVNGSQSVYGAPQSVAGGYAPSMGGGGYAQSIGGGYSVAGDSYNNGRSSAFQPQSRYGPTMMNDALGDNMSASMVRSYYSQNQQQNR